MISSLFSEGQTVAKLDAVTGAFGFTGRAITARLVADGGEVVTLTRRMSHPNPYGDRLRVLPADFGQPAAISAALTGVDTLYDTMWLRVERDASTFAAAVERTRVLMRAAREAGVRRVVYISVANADGDSPLPYWSAKGRAEQVVRDSGVPWSIVRPTILFGTDDILINDLAWFLRRFPAFVLPVHAERTVQPVHVDDVAALAVGQSGGPGGATIDAAGPEVLTFRDMVGHVRRAVGSHAVLLPLPPALGLLGARIAGALLRDVVLTRDEIRAIDLGLLRSRQEPMGRTAFSEWVSTNGDRLGRRYASEMSRNYRLAAAGSGTVGEGALRR